MIFSCRCCGSAFVARNHESVRCSDACREKERSERNYIRFYDRCIPEPNSGCWLWLGEIALRGMPYGKFKMNGKTRAAHHVSFELFNGQRIPGFQVLHHCDNPYCVNPEHLYLGTHADNMRDKISRNRCAKGEQLRSKLTADQIITIRSRYDGRRGFYAKVAREFSVDGSTIRDIVLRNLWKHIP
jgi:hypothetical protein